MIVSYCQLGLYASLLRRACRTIARITTILLYLKAWNWTRIKPSTLEYKTASFARMMVLAADCVQRTLDQAADTTTLASIRHFAGVAVRYQQTISAEQSLSSKSCGIFDQVWCSFAALR